MEQEEQIVTKDKDALVDIANQLRTAREAASLSRLEVAQKLHLDESIIEILESGDFKRLTSMTYVAGYIRSYAKLLRLPVEKILVQLYETNDENHAIVPTYLRGKSIKFSKANSGRKFALILLVVVILLAATWWIVRNIEVINVFDSVTTKQYQTVFNSHK